MKKKMFFAAVAALVSLASCQKENITDNGTDNKVSPVFTASIAGSTKTTVDLTDGKVAWEATDEITVTDASTASAVYTIESIDATTGKATFVIKDGETALGDGPYTATYGTEPATAQTYSATAGKLYMTATATSSNSFTFEVQCGLMKLNLTKPGESVKSIAVTSSTDMTYTLTCDPAESIATAKDFCIALPEGSFTKIEITNAEDITCTLNSAAGVSVSANHIKPVTFGESKINFALVTTGTAKATIGGSDVEVNWVQLWKDGPKFAEYNIGSTVEKIDGIDMEFYDAIKTGDNYAWGANWRTPNKDEMDELSLAARENSDARITCKYEQVGEIWGFTFTGKEAGYTGNQVFFPGTIGHSDSAGGWGKYWSCTDNGSTAWLLYLSTYIPSCGWQNGGKSFEFFVRPVLNEAK